MAFLTRKWNRELDYRLIKEIWTFRENRIAVRFAYEWHDDSFNWFRSYGNENWEFNADGLMQRRIASINDLPIAEKERKYHWPLGRRPDDHPTLSEGIGRRRCLIGKRPREMHPWDIAGGVHRSLVIYGGRVPPGLRHRALGPLMALSRHLCRR